MRCSYSELKDFEKSRIWLDILDEIRLWKEVVQNKINDPIETPDLDTLRTLQGNLYAFDKFEHVIDVMKSTFGESEEDDG